MSNFHTQPEIKENDQEENEFSMNQVPVIKRYEPIDSKEDPDDGNYIKKPSKVTNKLTPFKEGKLSGNKPTKLDPLNQDAKPLKSSIRDKTNPNRKPVKFADDFKSNLIDFKSSDNQKNISIFLSISN
jgi:hypothetical protein